MDSQDLIKQFNISTREYMNHRSDEHLSSIQRSLQVLPASSDPSVFDLSNKDIIDFFVNLHELMIVHDAQSNVTWSAVNVLLAACRNSTTRERLVHTYKFAPILTKLLRLELGSNEKNLKVLQLLQELTYGVNISWQEAHLSVLISTLTKWIVANDETLILLSLGVLVNLCYKNVPAVYTLMRSVDIKKFIKAILKLQKNNDPLRVQVCKLMIILKDVSGGVPDPEIDTYVESTCPTLIEALSKGSACLMRHIVIFFKEIITNPKSSHVLKNYKNFDRDTEKLLNSIKEDEVSLDCVGVLLEYFQCLIQLNCTELEFYYPRILQFALRWISNVDISTDSLKLICCMVSKVFSVSEETPLTRALIDILDENTSVILLILEIRDNGLLNNSYFIKLTALLHLLSEMLKVPKLADNIICSINQSVLEKLFQPLKNPVIRDSNIFQEPVYSFYVHALLFLTDLADKDTNWFIMYRELLREKQVLTVLSAALYTGPEDIKKRVLSLTGTTGFSTECIAMLAGCMQELNQLIIFSPSEKSCEEQPTTSQNISPMDITPLMTMTQEGYLNALLEKYEDAASKSNEIMTSSLIEFYHLKMAAMSQSIRCMQTSQEATDLRATRLQHSLALASSEIFRLHQLLHSTHQNLEVNAIESAKVCERMGELETKAQEIHNKYDQVVQTLRSKTRIVTEQNEQIDNLKAVIKMNENSIQQLKEELKIMENRNEGLLKEKIMLEDNIENLQKIISDNKKENDSNLKKINTLKKEIMAQSDKISELQKLNSEKEIEIGSLCKELQEQKRTRERILEVAMGKL
uniref:Putative structural maintenance of chromosome protein 4 chromosome condensation complex condensin n=1 Tax=Triatoma infestans TaxID=30076 RepID=A0A023EY49_TRIIF